MTAVVGKKAPDFELPATGDKTLRLSSLKGNQVVLYFYPKDSTPGCTLEGQNFRDQQKKFDKIGTIIIGISRDSLRSHENFKAREGFDFDLLSDTEEAACTAYDVIKEKNMYGKKVMGVERSTFLIDKNGVLRQEWRKVKVPGHVDEVLAAATALSKS
ncbi:MAG: peroxiredoxin [Pseudomonadota bacterium]